MGWLAGHLGPCSSFSWALCVTEWRGFPILPTALYCGMLSLPLIAIKNALSGFKVQILLPPLWAICVCLSRAATLFN